MTTWCAAIKNWDVCALPFTLFKQSSKVLVEGWKDYFYSSSDLPVVYWTSDSSYGEASTFEVMAEKDGTWTKYLISKQYAPSDAWITIFLTLVILFFVSGCMFIFCKRFRRMFQRKASDNVELVNQESQTTPAITWQPAMEMPSVPAAWLGNRFSDAPEETRFYIEDEMV